MGYWGYYPPYVSVAEKKAKAAKKLAQLRKKNPDIRPIVIQGKTIAKTWWGKSWNVNLERYADYANRIDRGRSYVRNGMVLDLKITPGQVEALVMGTQSRPYSVTVKISGISKDIWGDMKQACKGRLDSLQELLTGKFPKALEDSFTAKGRGLFPSPKEIRFSCSCPDWASMCKHVAAVLYGIGSRLDEDPMLFFTLRKVDVDDLVTEAVADNTKRLLDKAGMKSGRTLDEADLSEMFGIDIETESPSEKASPHKAAVPEKPAESKPAAKPLSKKKPAPAKKPLKSRKPLEKSASGKNTGQGKPVLKAVSLVESIIVKSRKGVGIPELVEKTGFDRAKIYGIVHRLKQQNRIVSADWGVYKKGPAAKN